MPHDHPTCPMAASISVSHCEHGHVFIRLHGPDGELIAAASMDAQVAGRFVGEIEDNIEALSSGEDTEEALPFAVWNLPADLPDELATEVDDGALRLAVQEWRDRGQTSDAMTSIFAGLQSAALRFIFPFRDRRNALPVMALGLDQGTFEMLQHLERVEAFGWETAAPEAVAPAGTRKH